MSQGPPGPPPPLTVKFIPPKVMPTSGRSLADILASKREVKPKKSPVFVASPVYHPGVDATTPNLNRLKIVVVSDSHNNHDLLDMPDGDILLHCGDMTDEGTEKEIEKVNEWFGKQKGKYKMGIYSIVGNHEKQIQKYSKDEIQQRLSNAIYLQDSHALIDGKIKIYGSPWVENMGNFPNEKTYEDNKYWYCDKPVLEQKWKQIPDDIHILITHSPRYRTLDGVYGFGCSHLAHRVSELSSLRVHCFGHVHMSYGNKRDGDLLSINAAVDDEEQPHVFEYFY